ncbi:hypothetical protein QEZ54_20460 [Catellatospora sp. KI3]|uniref:hypothetical protein n=1 Tax=Catellatospora sp. KI3 TaxID=3041620 RepID=UPI002482DC4A|nr:hypothetical protein [Catellatospora sp. KI3]MDI1463359.1 hypothetical protein [Catellatospora sp. KI3]
MAEGLPNDVDEIIDLIARWAAGYSTGLKWNEVAKLKADMMNVPSRWRNVTTASLRTKCLSAGLSVDDTEIIVELLRKRQAGRRLRPTAGYRDFRFQQLPVEGPTVCIAVAAGDV